MHIHHHKILAIFIQPHTILPVHTQPHTIPPGHIYPAKILPIHIQPLTTPPGNHTQPHTFLPSHNLPRTIYPSQIQLYTAILITTSIHKFPRNNAQSHRSMETDSPTWLSVLITFNPARSHLTAHMPKEQQQQQQFDLLPHSHIMHFHTTPFPRNLTPYTKSNRPNATDSYLFPQIPIQPQITPPSSTQRQ